MNNEIREIAIEILKLVDILEAYLILASLKDGKTDIKNLLKISNEFKGQLFKKDVIENNNKAYDTYLILLEYDAVRMNEDGMISITDIGMALYHELIMISHIMTYTEHITN